MCEECFKSKNAIVSVFFSFCFLDQKRSVISLFQAILGSIELGILSRSHKRLRFDEINGFVNDATGGDCVRCIGMYRLLQRASSTTDGGRGCNRTSAAETVRREWTRIRHKCRQIRCADRCICIFTNWRRIRVVQIEVVQFAYLASADIRRDRHWREGNTQCRCDGYRRRWVVVVARQRFRKLVRIQIGVEFVVAGWCGEREIGWATATTQRARFILKCEYKIDFLVKYSRNSIDDMRFSPWLVSLASTFGRCTAVAS